jgi:hypothetical protein
MDAMNDHMHSRRAANGITAFRGAVMAGFLVSTLMTALPSITFADGRDGDRKDDKGKHSLVQHPYDAHAVKNPFAILQAQIDTLTKQQALIGPLQAQVDTLTKQLALIGPLQAQVNTLTVANTQLTEANAALQVALNAAKADISTMKVSVVALDKKAVDIIPDLATYLKVDKTTMVNNVVKPDILFTGANVHVRSGSGATDDKGALTGLGNLIIGYNENTTTPTLTRTGSHNVVGGSMNSYGSHGGMVFGYENTVSGPYATVLSGNRNVAQGINSTVLGKTSQKAVNMNSISPTSLSTTPAPGGG